MKACLMKVNYDPKYISPGIKTSDNLQTRLTLTKKVYNKKSKSEPSSQISPTKHHLSAPDFAFRSLKGPDQDKSTYKYSVQKTTSSKNADNDTAKTTPSKQQSSPEASPSVTKSKTKLTEHHKTAVARAHASVKLLPLKDSSNKLYTSDSNWMHNNNNNMPESRKTGPYSERLPRRHLTQSNFTLFNAHRKSAVSNSDKHGVENNSKDQQSSPSMQRSKTLPPSERMKVRSIAMIELERRARIEAEKAMRDKKIFAIHGPYPSLRSSLRSRGWVEKFNNTGSQSETQNKKKPPSSPDSDADAEENSSRRSKTKRTTNTIHPWDEDNGYYGVMSYLVRNSTPTFVFSVKHSSVDSRITKSGQLVNHFGKSRNFTTKTGLCLNLRSVPWYDETDPDTFYPRCYKVDEDDEKNAFIEDYHRTACMGFLKVFVQRYKDPKNIPSTSDDTKSPGQRNPRLPLVTVKALEMAIQQCERFLRFQGHADIDDLYETDVPAECQWTQFRSWYTLFVHECCDIIPVSTAMVSECEELLEQLEANWSQYHLDGVRNVWILKPGAKSRGRGIHCEDNFDEIFKAADAPDGSLVIQKYIERPMLVYETKFDIRQWFLVTDWNPLTIWFYKDSYLRFCSREFSLMDFNPAIHLANNSVQKHLVNGPRSAKLPEDNTWTNDEFCEYLKETNKDALWQNTVVAGMKKAIVCSLLCTQEFIEYRKGAFELYGADFMLTEDMQPWLLEINSSPSMAQNTHATSELVTKVMEDTLKVVLDRRLDKNTDTGRFELAYKQPMIHDPPPLEHSLVVQGKRVRSQNKTTSKQPPSKSKGSR